jgi:hypothetical protein
MVAAYLSHLGQSGLRASSIGRKAAAIGHRHKLAGHEPPTGQEGVRAVLRGIRRTIGAAKTGKAQRPPMFSPPCCASARRRSQARGIGRYWRSASPARSAAASWSRSRSPI